MDLPGRAQAMYASWWNFVSYAATATDESGRHTYSVADVSAAASDISRTVGGAYASYDPIGVSQLFSVARSLSNSSAALAAADPSSPITGSMVSEPPWSRPAADQAAMPMWQARAEITYTDPAGVEMTGISTVMIPQVLPSTVGSLQAQMELRITDQLAAPPGTGTPRSGSLISVDSITLLAV